MPRPKLENVGANDGKTEELKQRLHGDIFRKFQAIKKECYKNKTPFEDKDFPTTIDDPTLNQVGVKWLRPGEFADGSDLVDLKWTIFSNPSEKDVIQGYLSNCWLLAGIAAFSNRIGLLEDAFYDPHYSSLGMYAVELSVNGEYKAVVVDDRFPCDPLNRLLFAKSNRRQLWVMIIEKAIAKLFGGYSNLDREINCESMRLLTGCSIQTLFTDSGRTHFIESLQNALKNNFEMVFGSGSKYLTDKDYEKVDLRKDHAFNLLALTKMGNTTLLLLRDVSGRKAWSGDWSPRSLKWKKIKKSSQPEEGKGNPDEGTFWISVDDMLRYFELANVCMVRDFGYEYYRTGKLYEVGDSEWDAFEIEVSESVNLDCHLQSIDIMQKPERIAPLTFLIFDENQKFIAMSGVAIMFSASCVCGILPKGKYFVYVVSLARWKSNECEEDQSVPQEPNPMQSFTMDKLCHRDLIWNKPIDPDRVRYRFSVHSDKSVKHSQIQVEPGEIAKVLLRMAIVDGEKVMLPHAFKNDITVYLIKVKVLGARVLAVVNKSQSQAFSIISEPDKCLTRLYSTRTTGCHHTWDIIPPNHSQVIQVFLLDERNWNDYKTEDIPVYLDRASQDEVFNAESFHSPNLTASSQHIHRLVPTPDICEGRNPSYSPMY